MRNALANQIGRVYSSHTVRLISGLAGGGMLAAAFGIIGSLIQARFVSPADLGYFRSFGIVTGYVSFLSLGLFVAVQRLYPYYVGKGQLDQGVAAAEICQAWSLAVVGVVSSIFTMLAFRAAISGDWRAVLGWLVQVVVIAGFIYGGYLHATFRSKHEFAVIARSSVISGTIGLLVLPVFLVLPYVAMALRSSTGTLTELVYLHFHRPLRLSWRFNWREWRELVKEGFPIYTAGYGLSTLWIVVESTIVLHFLGTQALGFWSVSAMLVTAANLIPQSVTAVYTPRLTESYGRTESVAEGLRLSRRPTFWGLSVTLLVVVAAWVVLPFVVPVLIPKYVGAIPTMCLMMLVLPLILLVELPYALLVAMGKTTQQNISVFASLGCFALLALAAVQWGLGLNGVVVASLLGRFIRMLFTYGFVAANRAPTK